MYCLVSIVISVFTLFFIFNKRKVKNIKDKHVVITGGSSGIGLAVAIECIKNGAKIVSIIGRNKEKLAKAKEDIEKHITNPDGQTVETVSINIGEYDGTKDALQKLQEKCPIFMLVNCAGLAICGRIEDTSVDDVHTMVNTNFLGTFHTIKTVLPWMKERQEGIVVITASQAALLGIYGLGVYSATKFALRGLAESLEMESRPYNISVTLSLPPDTDTPGFENENRGKPEETHLISEAGGLYQPETVAKKLLLDALAGKFFSSMGFESFLITTLCYGMSPFSSFFEVFLQSLLVGPIRLISACFVIHFRRIIYNCHKKSKK